MCLSAFVRLTRIEHAFLLALAVVIGQIISLRQLPDAAVLAFGALCPFFIEIGSFVFNDYLDVGADRRNKRKDRPLVTGEIKPRTALALAAVSFPLGVAFAGFLNAVCLAIALFFAIAAILYDFALKKWPFIGNVFIGFTMAIPFVFGNLSVRPDVYLPVSLLASMAFLMGIGREIIGSIRDMRGDKRQGRLTIPIVAGPQNAAYLAAFFMLFAVFISPIPFFYVAEYYGHLGYLIPVFLVDALLLLCVWWGLRLREFWKIRVITLATQGLGLAGFLLGLWV